MLKSVEVCPVIASPRRLAGRRISDGVRFDLMTNKVVNGDNLSSTYSATQIAKFHRADNIQFHFVYRCDSAK